MNSQQLDQHFEFANNYSTIPELISLLKLLRLNDPNVKVVNVGWKKLPPAYLNVLFSLLASNKIVTHVNLTKCNVTDEVREALAHFIRTNDVVVDLNLSKNNLSDIAIEYISTALVLRASTTTHRMGIRKLVLEGNQFTERGIDVLCHAIPSTNIEVLKIGKIELGIEGARHVLNMLMKSSCKLRKLDLRSCKLGSNGASIIFNALARNKSLESLCLGKNYIDDVAIQDLVEALRSNETLRTLDLQYNVITDAGATAIARCLDDDNYTLSKLILRHCDGISKDVKETLLDILVVNSFGPELAFKTKDALRCILSEESSSSDDTETSVSAEDPRESRTLENSPLLHNTDYFFAQTKTHPPLLTTENDESCVICYDSTVDCVLLPCKHRNCCRICAQRMKSCHMCREVIVKVFQTIIVSNSKYENSASC